MEQLQPSEAAKKNWRSLFVLHRPSKKDPGPKTQHTGVNRLGAKVAVGAFYAGLVLTAGLSVASYANSTAPAEQAGSSIQASPDTTAAQALAQRYVAAWLSASQTDQTRVQAVTGSTLPVAPSKALEFSELAVAGVHHDQQSGLVSVTVSALITEPVATEQPESKSASAQAKKPAAHTRYFTVVIAQQDQAVSVVGYPAPVAGPAPAPEVSLGYPQRVHEDTELGQAVTGFLQAYAAGAGEVGRYTAPGTEISPISPASYAKVTFAELRADQAVPDQPANGQSLRVMVTAQAALLDTTASEMTVSWALQMTARDGRWEITSIDPTPALAPDSSPQEPTPAPTPTSTSSTN